MKRGVPLFVLSGVLLLSGCTQLYTEQDAAYLLDSFTKEPILITAAAPTITPQRSTATPLHTEDALSLPTHTPLGGETEGDATPDTWLPTPTPASTDQISLTPSPTPAPEPNAKALLELVTALQDTPYCPDGDNPEDGFDTAGFVYYCLNEIGLKTPRRTARGYSEMKDWDTVTYLSSAQPGDLLFFVTGEEKEIDCVCIYLGNGKMTYPSTSRGAVITVSSTTEYWKNHFRLGKRLF